MLPTDGTLSLCSTPFSAIQARCAQSASASSGERFLKRLVGLSVSSERFETLTKRTECKALVVGFTVSCSASE